MTEAFLHYHTTTLFCISFVSLSIATAHLPFAASEWRGAEVGVE